MSTDVKHLRAAIALSEERNFTRAALRLRLGQSGLTKQIHSLEEGLGYALFLRDGRSVELTSAGEVFVSEARLALQHIERALHLSKLTVHGAEQILAIGKTPYTDPYLVTKLYALRLPLTPNLKLHTSNKLVMDLQRDLLAGSLDAAFLDDLPESTAITSVKVGEYRLFVLMLDTHLLASQLSVEAETLRENSCVLFERHVQPYFYDQLVAQIQPATVGGARLHHAMTAEDALHLVATGHGIAILPQSSAWRIQRKGFAIRPLAGERFRTTTRLATRSDNQSRLVSDFVRSYMRLLQGHTGQSQLSLPLQK